MRAILLLSLFVVVSVTIQAKQFILRPLSAAEIYRLLASTGRSDALPEGGIVTQGLTMIGNLTRRLRGGGSGSGSEVRVSTQEVCFETRSARSLAEAEAVFGAYVAASNRPADKPLRKRVRASEVGRILKLKKRKKLRNDEEQTKGNQRIKNPEDEPISLLGLGSRMGVAIANNNADRHTNLPSQRATLTSNPAIMAGLTNTATNVTTNAETTMNGDAGDATISTSTLSTTPEGAINCIVIKRNE